MTVFGICQLGGKTEICIKNGRYSVFQSLNDDGNIQFRIENTAVTVFIQKFDYGIMVVFEKINGNKVIQNLVRPFPPTYNLIIFDNINSKEKSRQSSLL